MARVKGSPKLIGMIFAGVGLLLASNSAVVWKMRLDFEADAVRVPGTVIRLDGGGKGRRPVVRFLAEAEDREVEITGKISSSPPAYDIGERVMVMYPPGHPEDGLIEGFLEQYFLIAIFGGLGTLFATIGFGLLIADARGKIPPVK